MPPDTKRAWVATKLPICEVNLIAFLKFAPLDELSESGSKWESAEVTVRNVAIPLSGGRNLIIRRIDSGSVLALTMSDFISPSSARDGRRACQSKKQTSSNVALATRSCMS